MEYLVDLGHGEVFFHLNNEKVDHLLIRLQQVDRVLTLTDQDFCLFVGEEFCVLLVDDAEMLELEGRVYQGYEVRVIMRQSFLRDLKVSKDLACRFFIVYLEGLEA